MKNTQSKTTPKWTDLFVVNDVWLYILEFIPAVKIIRTISILDKYHHDLINSPHTYAHLLVRDIIEYDIVPKYMVKKILAQYDYKRIISKLVNTKVKVMKLSKKDNHSEVDLSLHELQIIKKSFQNMFTQLNGIMTRILEYKLSDSEHRLFFMGERLERVLLPKEFIEEEDDDEDEEDWFDDYYEIVLPIDCPKHAVTQTDKHAFAERKIYSQNQKYMLYFCNCGLSYVISDPPNTFYEAPDLIKDGQQKVLYDVDETECKFTFVKRSIWNKSDYDLQDFEIPFEYKNSSQN